MNEIRIRDNLEVVPIYQWPNPPSPKPVKPRWKVCQEAHEKLVRDKKAWTLRCIWNGL